MPSKNSILKGIVNNTVTELYPKTAADNVFLVSNGAVTSNTVQSALDSMPTTTTVEGMISTAISELIDGAPSTYDTLKEISDWISTHEDAYQGLLADLANKVDKVTGKGLSTEDYTTAEKTKLSGIAEGATAVTVDDAISSTSENPVQNKVIYSALAGKVDTVSGKGLSTNDYTDTEKTKLAGIAEGANNYSLPTAAAGTLGGVKVGTNLAIDANGVLSGNYSNATSSAAGLMSATDKANLDGKPDVYVQASQPSGLKAGDIWFQISE